MLYETDIDVSREDLSEWIQQRTTQQIFDALKRLVLMEVQVLSNGGTVDLESVDATALQTAKSAGRISGMNEILNIREELIDLNEEE